MPIYTLDFTVMANTPKTSPAEETIEVEGRFLTRLSIFIPRGHHALTGLTLFYGLEQIFPKPSGTWLKGNDEVFEARLNWRLPLWETKLTFRAYNEDEVYDHTFYSRVETVEELEEARPWRVLADFISILRRLLGI